MKQVAFLVVCGLFCLWLAWPLSSDTTAGLGPAPEPPDSPASPGLSGPANLSGDAAGSGAVESPERATPPREDGGSERSAVSPRAGEATLRLAGACAALSPVAVVLVREDSFDERRLALREPRTLSDLPAGAWRVRCVERTWRGEEVRFELQPAGRPQVVDLPFEPLAPWYGRVLDADSGVPLGRARFALESRGTLAGQAVEGRLGQCELVLEVGQFALGAGAVLGAEARLLVEADGYAGLATPWIPWDGTVPVELGDLGLFRADGRRAGLAGRVLDAASGAPLAGVHVIAVPADTRPEDLWVHAGSIQGAPALEARAALTDARGEFALEVEGPELVRVAAFRPSHGLALGLPVPCRPGAELALARRAVLRGRVLASDEVRVAGGLNGVFVSGDGTSALLALDDDLEFELGGLATGRLRVALQALEQQTGGQRVAAEVLVESVDVREGEVVELLLRYPPDPEGPALAGRVLLPADVEFEMLRAALWPAGEAGPTRFAVVDREGRFSLPGPLPESGWLFVGGSSADPSRGLVIGTSWAAGRPPASNVELDARAPALRGEATAAGTAAARCAVVVAADDGEPAWARAVAEGLSITTDAAGRFEVFGLLPGRYEVGRLGGVRQTVQVGATGEARLQLRLE